ncbi:MAG: TonB-dependent receptor plug domain-containing protein [Opitutales bacterium]|nr:TonB-dependent receptor plug domain-containing protein [Opitutales bacterium]
MKTKFWKIVPSMLVAVIAANVSLAQDESGEIIELEAYVVKAMEDFASRAIEGETPVSFSTVDKEQIVSMLGSRDIPLVLDTTPSVYATAQGGGAGDARINIRGFNQRNIAVMINGIPQNDMENGWVYWSNWDGVGDAAASIQVQRGMSNVNLATPSVGGTLNILTDPAAQAMGGSFRQEFGTGNFLKTTVAAHTGLLYDKFAMSATIVRKTADDYAGIDKTWSDAWAYYVGASYIINETNRLDMTILGAPQRHGQNLYEHNVAEYDQGFARKLGADPASFARYPEQGRRWNENWSPITPAYTGKQHFNGGLHVRHDSTFIPERENYFHKPVISVNWILNVNADLDVNTSVYWSGGTGGGTGSYYVRTGPDGTRYPFGRQLSFDGSRPGFGAFSYDAQANYEQNISNAQGNSTSILRNSVNRQWTWGAISKATYRSSDEMTWQVGVDWRKAEIKHFREVRDLLGGSFFFESNDVNDFWNNGGPGGGYTKVGLGDKIDYNNKNMVDWLGVYAQGEYKTEDLTLFGMAGWSQIEYGHENYFKSTTGGPDGDIVRLNPDALDGYQMKAGVRYSFTNEWDGYANIGYFDKVPNVDGVLNDSSSILNPDPQNEKITSAEIGINFSDENGVWALDANLYYTKWEDRTVVESIQISQDEFGLANLSGVNQTHSGLEIEATYMPIKELRFDAAIGIGNWEYTDDATGSVQEFGGDPLEYNYYIKDLKVGDQPQKQFVLQSTYYPFDGLSLNLVSKWNGDMYAEFDPTDRTDSSDRAQSWKTPAYWVFDAHLNWDTTIDTPWAPLDVTFFVHVFNVFDEIYVAEATDNDGFNAFDRDHDADDAGVFLGLPRYWNTGFRIRF